MRARWRIAAAAALIAAGVQPVGGARAAQAPDGADRTAFAARPHLGVNVDGPLDWGREHPFADAMKEARPFGTLASPEDEAAPKDSDGWPTEDAAVIVIADTPGIDGTYRLSCTGRGHVSANGGVRVENVAYDARSDTTTAGVVVTPGTMDLHLRFRGFAGGVKHVSLMRPGHAAGDLFTRDFLARLAHFSTLRTLGWSQVNGSPEVNWSERTLPSHATQARRKGPNGPRYGAAWEYFADLCNRTGADAWINVPDQATDDYVVQLARLLRGRLDPRLKIYVEWSNEVWNFAPDFEQSRRNLEAATAELRGTDPHRLAYDGNRNPYDAAWRRIAYQAKRMSDLFRSVFGEEAFLARVRPVLATQIANAWVYQQGLRYLEHVHGPPRDVLWGLAGTSYFYLPREDRKDLTVDQIFAELDLSTTRGWMQKLSAWAWAYGLKPLCYEGGHHIAGAESLRAKLAANMDPRMTQVLVRNYRDWYEAGGALHNYVALVGRWGPFGQWGLSQSVATEATPKWEAVKEMAAAAPPPPKVGRALPATLRSSDASVVGDGRDVAAGRVLAGRDPDVAWLVRSSSSGSFRIATEAFSDGRATVALEVDGIPAARWALEEGGRPRPQSATVQLAPGLHALRVRLLDGGSATIRPLTVDQERAAR